MTDDETNYTELSPTEILIYIFLFLTPKQRAKCRQVCLRWKLIIDNLSINERLWRRQCKWDFKDIYLSAYYKSAPALNWCNIYRSLTLWSKLDQAIESRDEFASASSRLDEIRDFQILRNGTVGVQTRAAIVYYDINTLKQSERTAITGNYLRYAENEDTVIILGYNLNLFVMKKILSRNRGEGDIEFYNVKLFLLDGQDLFYITLNDEVYFCNLQEKKLKSVLLNQTDSIMSIGYNDGRINLLTFQRDIFTIIGKKLVHRGSLDSSTNLLHELKKYNLLENLDWRVYFQWMFVLKHYIPQGPLRDVIIIKTYGDTVFVGSSLGVFRIYYAPYRNNQLDLHNSKPIKQYNFMERCDCPVLSMCPIIQIDVIEGEDKHKILVAMPKKIAILEYRHIFEVQNIKVLEITE